MSHTLRPRFGIMTAPMQVDYQDVLRVWREADAVPEIEHAWLFDQLMPIGGWSEGVSRKGRGTRLAHDVRVSGQVVHTIHTCRGAAEWGPCPDAPAVPAAHAPPLRPTLRNARAVLRRHSRCAVADSSPSPGRAGPGVPARVGPPHRPPRR
ncbi:hypothetical protein GCM10010254_42730 [Streptomyces chromofuscus]|nr:hypothetical protein GCM10010254_42730 [Streptomyces chromofuscus]